MENVDPEDILKKVLYSIEKRKEELGNVGESLDETREGMGEGSEENVLMTSTHNVEIQMNAVLTTSGSNIQLKGEEDARMRRRSRFSEIVERQEEFEKSVGEIQKKKDKDALMPKSATVSARRRSAVLEMIQEAQGRGSNSSTDSRKSTASEGSSALHTHNAGAAPFALKHRRSPSQGDNVPKPSAAAMVKDESVIVLDDSVSISEHRDKLTPLKSATSLPSAADLWSPKPYNSNATPTNYSPVFSGLSSASKSSPKLTAIWSHAQELDNKKAENSANASVVSTETIQLKQHNELPKTSSPVRATAIQPGSARKAALLLEQKLNPRGTVASPLVKPHTPTLPAGVQTQFRGSHCVPVVAGAKAEEPTPKPHVSAGKVNQLKNRWEFVTATGTPLHPDESEDALLAAARRMQQNVPYQPSRTKNRLFNTNKTSGFKDSNSSGERENCSSESDEGKNYNQPSPLSRQQQPANSMALFDGSVSPIGKSVELKEREAELEDDVFEEVQIAAARNQVVHAKSDEANTSRVIDEAFEFMGSYDSPVSAANAAGAFRSPRKSFGFDNEFGRLHTTAVPGSLPYTISFYRRMAKEMQEDDNAEKIDLNAQHISTSSLNTNAAIAYSSPMKDGAKTIDVAKYRMHLEKELMAQDERISQAMRALAYCQEKPEFAGSREEVDAQRACLIATETHNVLRNSLYQLEAGKRKTILGPLGEVTFRSIVIRLDSNYNFHPNPSEIYYFLVLLRCGDVVEASRVVSSDEALRNELRLDFALGQHITLTNLQPDFEAFLDIYFLRAKRESLSHEEKYKLPGATLKKKGVLEGIFGESAKSKTLSRGSGSSYVDRTTDRKFNWAGRMVVNLRTPARSKHQIKDVKYPLGPEAIIKFTKQPLTHSDVSHSSFLSLFHRTSEGIASWVRLWCRLTSTDMTFWKYIEDETNHKPPTVVLDLLTLATDGIMEDRSACPYPNSFHLDMWSPKTDSPNEVERLRVTLAADTKAEMCMWLELIRKVTAENALWNQQVITAV